MTMYKDPIRDKFVEEYWYKKLSGSDYNNVLFNRVARHAAQREHSLVLSDQATENIDHLAKGNESGKLVVCLALFSFLVHKYLQVGKLLIYSPATDSPVAFFPQQAPYFFRLSLDPETSFKQLIVQVADEVKECATHGDYRFDTLKSRFADRKIDGDLVQSIGFYYAPVNHNQLDTDNSKLLFGINIDEQGKATVFLRSSAGILSEHAEKDFIHRFHKLLNDLPGLLDKQVKDWEWLTDHERETIFVPGALSPQSVSRGKLTELFEAQVAHSPEKIALHDGQQAYTYKMLNRESNRLAHYLREQVGVCGQDIVLLLLDRSLNTGIAIWGVLKSGGILLQADPYTSAIEELLKDVQPKCIITQMQYLNKLEGYEGNIFAMDVQMSVLDMSIENPGPVNSPEDVACVVYTAGTDGKSRGALITHSAISGLLAMDDLLTSDGLKQEFIRIAVVAVTGTASFFKQFFSAHLTGASLYIVQQELTKEPDALWKYYSQFEIDLTDTNPSLLNSLAQAFPKGDLPLRLQYWMVREERLSKSSLELLKSCFAQMGAVITVWEEYGVTECFANVIIYSLCSNVSVDGSPVSRMPQGMQVFIVDEYLRLVPAGVTGQVAISLWEGCKGYINDPETTALKFIISPFPEWDGNLFLTGDSGVRLPDGNISVTGRFGSVEANVLPSPLEPGEEENKIVAPRNAMEELLLGIWQKTLRSPGVTIFTDFFSKGGDSIKAIQISSQLHGAGYKMIIRDIFQYTTIAQLAPRIVPLERETDQAPVTGEIPLTPIQQWFVSLHKNAPGHFNQSVLLRFTRMLDKQQVLTVFNKLQEHHDALRMTFRQNEQGDWIQNNNEPEFPISLRVFDLRTTDDPLSILARKSEEIQGSIQLSSGPLMKLGLFHLGDGSRLLVVINHLVVDAVSFRILLDDIAVLFAQYDKEVAGHLPMKTDSYKKWAETLVEYANDARFLREKDYWNKLQNNLLTSKAGNVNRPFRMKETRFLSFELSQHETSGLLSEANRAFNTEIQDLLITAFLLAWKKSWQQHQLTLMLEGHGRESVAGDLNVSRTVGWFTSLYPVQFDILDEEDLANQIIIVKEQIRKVPNNGIGYGILGYSHLFPPVIFNYLGQFEEDREDRIFRIADEDHGHAHSGETEILFDMEVTGMISDGKLKMGVTYPLGLYGEEKPAEFWNAYREMVREIIRYCSKSKQTRFTPSDFTYKELSIEQVDTICQKYKVEDIYPLSPLQEGILFTCLYREDSTVYFEQLSYRMVDKDLNPEWVRESLRELIGRHAVLRTAFMYGSLDRAVQVVLKEANEDFYFEDLRGMKAQEEYILHYKEKDKQSSFNLETGMLLRVAIFRLKEEEYEFVWSHHHIAMDAWCQGILIREYYNIYNKLSGKNGAHLSPVNPYRTYIQWLESRDKELSREYWRNYLLSYEKPAVLPKKHAAHKGIKYLKKSLMLRLESEAVSMLQDTATRYQLTMNTLMQAAWGVVLAKYNNTTDVVFGSVVSGRPGDIPDVDSMVGLFINTIPVRVQFDQDTSFLAMAGKLQHDALAASPWHYESLAMIQALSALQQPMINHIFLFDNFPTSEEQLDAAGQGDRVYIPDIYQFEEFEGVDYDLNIRIRADKDIFIRFDYNASVFDEFVLTEMLSGLASLLRTVAINPQCNVTSVEIVSPEQKIKLKELATGRCVDIGAASIISEFDKQVALHYNETAIEFQDGCLTYGQLQERSDFLGQHLLSRFKVQPGDIIAILMNRSELPVIAILGILKSGAAFVPIEAGLPQERKAFILKDAGVKLVLTESEFLEELQTFYQQNLVALDLLEFGVGSQKALPPADPSGPAYVIYTSGSTGTPKGVCVEMKSLTNYICWANDYYFKNEKGHSFGLFTSLSFDLTITSLFSGLLRGDKLIVLPSDMEINDLFIYVFEKQPAINVVKITPSHVQLLNNLPVLKTSISTVILGGEKVTGEHIETLRRLNPAIRIFNEYGPTEATVGCTVKEICHADEAAGIGTPIWNTEVYILNTEGNVQPIGTPGELYIGGTCVSRGYLNRPELTAARFEPAGIADGHILYRTGDQVMCTGREIEYMGRLDEQLKIRGHRIEPGEIEKAIMQLPGITAAVVIARQNSEHINEVIGYYTGKQIPAYSIRRQLSNFLPEYMIPHHLLFLESFPLNSSGKVNRLALPFYEEGEREECFVAPSNNIEEQLSGIWMQLLGSNKIGVNDNFFNLGGDSIKIIRLYYLIKKEFTEKIKVSDLYDNPTMAKQATIIATLTGKAVAVNEKVDLIDF